MNIVETCKCGGSIRLVGAPASVALEVASFRDAHEVCRQPEPSSVVPATERIDLPPTTQFVPQDCCPSCGHDVKGRAQCAAYFGDGPETCPCTNIWHNHGES